MRKKMKERRRGSDSGVKHVVPERERNGEREGERRKKLPGIQNIV
jgi:hypothetical protein